MNQSDLVRNSGMLSGSLARRGYMRFWHSFIGYDRLTGDSREFYIEYYIVNPALGKDEVVFGQHPYYRERGMSSSYCLIKAGVIGPDGLQICNFYPMDSVQYATKPLYVDVEGNVLSETRLIGEVYSSYSEAANEYLLTDQGSMSWDLEVHKAVACNIGRIADPLLGFIDWLDSYWHAEGLRCFYRGTVILNGREYDVEPEDCYGYADKHWGKAFNDPMLLMSSSHLISERTGRVLKHSALAVNGCHPRFLWFHLKKKIIIQLTYMGEDFEFSFLRPTLFTRIKWKLRSTNKRFIWRIKAMNRTACLQLSLECRRENMTTLDYENPTGEGYVSPFAGADGAGTLTLYRRTPEGLLELDTLEVKDLLVIYKP